jgi:hypothetical protein
VVAAVNGHVPDFLHEIPAYRYISRISVFSP